MDKFTIAMKFTGELDQASRRRVEACDIKLGDPARLKALRETGLMDTPREEAFDRLARLAAHVLKVPLTIVSLVSDQKQFFKAAYGLPQPLDETREIPIDGSICRYTLQGEPIIVPDAAKDPFLKNHPATGPWGIVAFVAIPMITDQGQVLGAFCAVDSKVRPWSDEDLEIMRELTASVMTEIHLRGQLAELGREREIRERFVNTLTHDLRTPLTASKLTAELMLRRATEPEQTKMLAGRIAQNMARADRMIQDLLDASLIKSGERVHLDPEPCQLPALIEESLSDLRVVHGNRFELQASEDVSVVWDRAAVRRIVENLAANAVKYGAPETPVLLSLKRIDSTVEIGVHNLGNPIPEDRQRVIFEPFHRLDGAAVHKGWGLGLTLVRGLAEAHGGKAQVASSAAEGTTFSVILPVDARFHTPG